MTKAHAPTCPCGPGWLCWGAMQEHGPLSDRVSMLMFPEFQSCPALWATALVSLPGMCHKISVPKPAHLQIGGNLETFEPL